LPGNQEVFGDSGEAATRQSLPGWASSALCFVLRIGPGKQKIAAKSVPKILVQALLRVLRREARMVRGAQNIWISILPAIATSMIAATGSAVRAAAQPQDLSQAPAGDSPFAILLAALSAQSTPAGDGADTEASSDTATNSPQNDQTGQPGKLIAAASEKSNADDHVAEAALAALLNTNAAPPPFSPPSPEAETSDTAPATALADTDKAQPANASTNPKPDASTPPTTSSVAGAPISPAPPVPGYVSAVPPESGDKVRPDARTTDASLPDASMEPVLSAAATDLAAPLPVSGGKADPTLKTRGASNTDAGPVNKVEPEKKSAAPDQSQTDITPAMIAAAYAGPAGQASTDQTTNSGVTADVTQSPSILATKAAGANPAKDLTGTGPANVTPPASDDADEPVAADMPNAGPIAAALLTKAATAPAKSTGASAKPAASKSQDKPQILSAAHVNPVIHAAAPKTDTPASSDDSAKLVQADPTSNAVPVAAGTAPHAAPPVAIIDPSAIMAPHAASAASPGASPAASFEITSAAADPVPDLNGFAVSIAARSLSGAKQFEIRLDPPELGRVDVRLSIDAAGKAVAHMATDQPQTLDLLRKDAPALTQALRDAGLDVSQNGLNFSLRGQDRQSDDSQSGTQGRKSSLSARLAIQAAQAPAALAYAGAASNARLDIHV
jgi:flagellar hook-length control protein FliK